MCEKCEQIKMEGFEGEAFNEMNADTEEELSNGRGDDE
jgi:hypothetical protein